MSEEEGYTIVPNTLLKCSGRAQLSGYAFGLLIDFWALWQMATRNGKRKVRSVNFTWGCGYQDLISRKGFYDARKQLVRAGFILEVKTPGGRGTGKFAWCHLADNANNGYSGADFTHTNNATEVQKVPAMGEYYPSLGEKRTTSITKTLSSTPPCPQVDPETVEGGASSKATSGTSKAGGMTAPSKRDGSLALKQESPANPDNVERLETHTTVRKVLSAFPDMKSGEAFRRKVETAIKEHGAQAALLATQTFKREGHSAARVFNHFESGTAEAAKRLASAVSWRRPFRGVFPDAVLEAVKRQGDFYYPAGGAGYQEPIEALWRAALAQGLAEASVLDMVRRMDKIKGRDNAG